MDVPVREGDVIDQTYQVERVIGTGGMAVVVSAIHLQEVKRYAIKILHKKVARYEEVIRRFQREMEAIQKLGSEHVARVYASGVVKGCPYMVMEYMQGSDLSDVLRTQGPLPVDLAVEYVLQATEAVAEAHAQGIIHRDLKPGNLFLTRRADGSPCVKILDFGIAKMQDTGKTGGEDTLTKTTAVFGSPFYMSPEQMISAKDVGPATDQWALGVILYELLAKAIPFADKSPDRVCVRVLNDAPDPLRARRPDVPQHLEDAIFKCLQRSLKQRHANVGHFAVAIEAYAPKSSAGLAARAVAYLQGVRPADVRASIPDYDVAPVRDPMEPPEIPTVYLRNAPSKKVPRNLGVPVLAASALGVFIAGFAAGVVARPSLPWLSPQAASTPAAASTAPTSTGQAPLSPVIASAPSTAAAPEESSAAAPVEINLDEASPTRRENKPSNKRKKDDSPESLMAAYDAVLAQGSASAGVKAAKPPPAKTSDESAPAKPDKGSGDKGSASEKTPPSPAPASS